MNITLDTIAQAGVFVSGVTAILLVARKNKWGFVVGLISQPFWFYTTYYHKQWGIFALNFAYLGTWLYGYYEWFYGKDSKRGAKK